MPEATRRPIDALLAGRIDVGVGVGLQADERIDLTPLFEDELVLIVAPTHRLASRDGRHGGGSRRRAPARVHRAAWRQLRSFAFVLEPAGRDAAARLGDPAHRGHRRDGEGRTRRRGARVVGRRAVRGRATRSSRCDSRRDGCTAAGRRRRSSSRRRRSTFENSAACSPLGPPAADAAKLSASATANERDSCAR